MKSKLLLILSCIGFLIPTVLQAATPTPLPAQKNLYQAMTVAGIFVDFLHACDLSGESEILKKPGTLTVLAPTDAAFAKLPDEQRHDLLSNKQKAIHLVKTHIVESTFNLEQLKSATAVVTISGAEFTVDNKRGLKVGQALVTRGAIDSINGSLYVLDSLIE